MKKRICFLELLAFFVSVALLLPNFSQTAVAAEDWQVYFGHLHGHSGDTDTIGSAAEVFADAKGNMDFFGLTDYSHSFDNANLGSITDGTVDSQAWTAGKQAAVDASDETFAAIFGYEMGFKTDPFHNHIATFATPGWQSRNQEGFDSIVDYYEALATVSGAIGMFCHPDSTYGDFDYFGHWQWDYDDRMALLEVIGEDGQTFYGDYQAALDQGWHVAPTANGASHHGNWGSITQARTAILAENLTEESLFDAIRARRVYATMDPSMEIFYRFDGHIMGSRVVNPDSYTATVTLTNPRGTVQVIGKNGAVTASAEAAANMTLVVEPGQPFYYLRIVEGEEILAVTAPVWVEELTDFGASALTLSPAVPVQHQEAALSFTLFNHEAVDMTVSAMELLADGNSIWVQREAVSLPAGDSEAFSVPYTHDGVGNTVFQLLVSGTIGGKPVSFDRTLEVTYRPAILNAHILVDGRHTGVTQSQIQNLVTLASEADMDVAIFREELPEGARVMILPPPTEDFSENYPQLLNDFVKKGGLLILCGTAGDNGRLNGLLAQLGATLRFHNDSATDPVHNGGVPGSIHPDVFQETAWDNLEDGTYYSQLHGCTIDPGLGTWLVKGKDTLEGDGDVLLAREALGDGQIIAAGSFFLDDEHMVLPRNPWDIPRANQLLLESILELQRVKLSLSDIRDVRNGTQGEIYRVTGYVTAGTSREGNRFPGLIYLQDGTGGIAVTGFDIPDIQVGFSLDIVGQLSTDGQNPALKLITCRRIENDLYRHDPAVSDHKTAMDYEHHGGELMKVEGTAESIRYTPDGLGVRRFTLRDANGGLATISIEDYILSGADGVNHLATQVMDGKEVRAYGILHREADGTPVLRVRNCDEVVYIPPIPERPEKGVPDLSNPATGDPFAGFFTFWGF